MPRVFRPSPDRSVSPSTARSLVAAAVTGVLVAALTLTVDAFTDAGPEIASGNARALLGANVGALVTIGAFSFWMRPLMAQLASSVVPPHLVSAHVHDRFQRRIVAVTVGALVYEVLVLLALPGPTAQAAPLVSTGLGTLVGGGAIIGLLVAMQHGERTMRPGRLLSEASNRVVDRLHERSTSLPDEVDPVTEPSTSGRVVRASATGWVGAVREEALLGDVPPGSVVRTEVTVGSFVTAGWTEVLTVWSADADEIDRDVLAAHVEVHEERGNDLDVSGALTYLVDVGVHAASDAAGAPSMVYEVLDRFGAVFHEVVRCELPVPFLHGEEDRTLIRGLRLERAELLDLALTRLRRSLAREPATALALVRMLQEVRAASVDHARHDAVDVLDRQLDLTVEQCRHGDPLPADLDQVVAARRGGRSDVPPEVEPMPGARSETG